MNFHLYRTVYSRYKLIGRSILWPCPIFDLIFDDWSDCLNIASNYHNHAGYDGGKLGEIRTIIEVKRTKSARKVEIDHSEP